MYILYNKKNFHSLWRLKCCEKNVTNPNRKVLKKNNKIGYEFLIFIQITFLYVTNVTSFKIAFFKLIKIQ